MRILYFKGLSACVHFWTPSDGTMDKYQDTVENRFVILVCVCIDSCIKFSSIILVKIMEVYCGNNCR